MHQHFKQKTHTQTYFIYLYIFLQIFSFIYLKYQGFCLKLKISITTEPSGFSIIGKLHITQVMQWLILFSDLGILMVLIYFSSPILFLQIQSHQMLGAQLLAFLKRKTSLVVLINYYFIVLMEVFPKILNNFYC